MSRNKLRGLKERFENSLMPLFARRTDKVNSLLREPYLHGLAQGDMDLALRGLLGDEAPISASTMALLMEKWQTEHETCRMVTFYNSPEEHWPHLRTSNVIGSPFAALRLRTSVSKRF